MKNNSASRFVALLLAAVALPCAATANEITFDFTGTIFLATGDFSTVTSGTPVNGTLTFDYSAALPSQSAGIFGASTAGTTNVWQAQASGGSNLGSPPVTAVVFRDVINIPGFVWSGVPFSYNGGYPNDFDTQSAIQGSSGSFSATEAFIVSPGGASGQSLFQLLAGPGPQDAYDSHGLPLFAHSSGGYGYVVESGSTLIPTGQFQFTIKSVTAVPLPAAVWLLLSALAALALIARSRLAIGPGDYDKAGGIGICVEA